MSRGLGDVYKRQSLIQGYTDSPKAINLNDMSFATSKAFNVNTAVVVVILSIIYISLW